MRHVPELPNDRVPFQHVRASYARDPRQARPESGGPPSRPRRTGWRDTRPRRDASPSTRQLGAATRSSSGRPISTLSRDCCRSRASRCVRSAQSQLALPREPTRLRWPVPPPRNRSRSANLPVELTSFVGRRREFGRPQAPSRPQPAPDDHRHRRGRQDPARPPSRRATSARPYPDGVWFVELGRAARTRSSSPMRWSRRSASRTASARWSVSAPHRLPRATSACSWSSTTASTCSTRRPSSRARCCALVPTSGSSPRAARRSGLPARPCRAARAALACRRTADGSAEAAARSDAVALFLERAAGAAGGSGGRARGRRPPAVLADRAGSLDGIPLALELAAGRFRTLGARRARRWARRAVPSRSRPATAAPRPVSDAPGDDRVELPPPDRQRAAALDAAVGVRRRVRAGCGRGGVRRRRAAGIARFGR